MLKFSFHLFLFCWFVYPSVGDPPGTRCERVEGAPSCVCKSPKGVIDLTKVASYNGTPSFTGLVDPNDFSYDYNPCIGFTGKDTCTDVQVCQQSQDKTYSYAIASYGTEEMWIGVDGEPYVYYTGPGLRETMVHLICDPSATEPIVTTMGDSQIYLLYFFTLRSIHACPAGANPVCLPVENAPSCVCRVSDGIIDLTKLASYTGIPRFRGVQDSSNSSYDYNPCAPFSSGSSCTNVHACQRTSDETNAIANYGSEEIRVDNDGKIYLHYTGPNKREVSVFLKCDPMNKDNPILTVTSNASTKTFEFTLTSCHACPGGC